MLHFVLMFLLISYATTDEYKVTDQVYLDIAIGGKYEGTIIIGLFGEIAPRTALNFYTIATDGIKDKTYSGSKFHRVIKRFMIQGGDIVSNNGTGSISIYGKHFKDENFIVKHKGAGFVSMANAGAHTNGCQFFITTIQTPWLDGLHVAFGKVIKGQEVVHKIEDIKTNSEDRPKKIVKIIKSGSIPTPKPFYVSDDEYTFFEFLRAGAVPLTMSILILTFFQYVIQRLKSFENIKIHDS